MRIAILGNSGSGKSTLARWHADRAGALLLFMNPGEEQCLANCRARPWEPPKYASKQEQDERLEFLLSWVREYYVREGDMSLAGHRACFDAYSGPKEELTAQVELEARNTGRYA